MKYRTYVEINLPIEEVIQLFDNPDNMKHWQPELISFEPISGDPGQAGAKSRLTYQMGKRKVEMIETITERRLPDHFSGTYEASGVYNQVVNTFEKLSDSKTRWITDNEFKFSGFMKIMAFFMKGAFKKQTYRYLIQFKEFAEQNAAQSYH